MRTIALFLASRHTAERVGAFQSLANGQLGNKRDIDRGQDWFQSWRGMPGKAVRIFPPLLPLTAEKAQSVMYFLIPAPNCSILLMGWDLRRTLAN